MMPDGGLLVLFVVAIDDQTAVFAVSLQAGPFA
jgi:hypothetical protein